MGSMRRNAGDTCTVVLVGDCGVGKTALVSALLEEMERVRSQVHSDVQINFIKGCVH